jgi:hypothetical protein
MRFSEEKIKQAILHPQLDIRQRAVRYFSDCHSEDEGVASLVIRAVEKYGRDDAYSLVGASADLRHTEETISWVIKELQDPATRRYENYAFNLLRVLCDADPALLLPWESEILETCGLSGDLKELLRRRLQLASWDEADCWRRIEQICEEGKDKTNARDAGLDYALDIVRSLARPGREVEQRVLSVLAQTVENFEHNPMRWMEPLMVKLAGLRRMETAVPAILGKLHEDDDVLSGYCVEALSRIGTDAVVTAVAEDCARAEQHFRLHATNVLGNVHSDLAVEKTLGLLVHETDPQVQQDLAHAALSHFASEAIEPVRQLLLSRRRLNSELRYLRDSLVETCTIMDESFPEFDEWQAAGENDREEHRRQMERLKDDPLAAMAWAFGKFQDELKSAQSGEEETLFPGNDADSVDQILADNRTDGGTSRIGRNEPCPCGSGKKYKKCCLRKQQN